MRILFWLSLIIAYPLMGQEACFDVNITTGCAPLTVQVIDCSGAAAGNILYDYGNGNKVTQTTFTYTQAGTYPITQYVGSGAGGDSLRKENLIVVREPQPIAFDLLPCPDQGLLLILTDTTRDTYTIDLGDGNRATLNATDTLIHYYPDTQLRNIRVQGTLPNCPSTDTVFAPQPNPATITIDRLEVLDDQRLQLTLSQTPAVADYQLEQQTDNGAFVVLQDLPIGTETLILDGLDLPNRSYSYRISQTNLCTGGRTSDQPIRTTYARLTVGNGNLGLQWTAQPLDSTQFEGYQITKDGNDFITLRDPRTTTAVDGDVRCRRRYCYRITATLTGGRQSVSQEVCADAQLTRSLRPPDSLRVTVNRANQIELTWGSLLDSLFNRMRFTRRDSVGIDTLTGNDKAAYIDFGANPNAQVFCYQVGYQDFCGNQSTFSAAVCPIRLQVTTDSLRFDLRWSAYQGSFEPLTYYLLKLDEERNVLDSIPVSSFRFGEQIADQSRQVLRFQVVAVGSQTGFAYASNSLLVRLPSRMLIADAFTPNGDGLNDTFGGVGRFIETYELRIFNALGNPIFYSDNLETRWDGTRNNGEALPAGVYFFQLRATDQIGRTYNIRNTVTLIRR
ncbi:MAG: gliding motility-associated C-terminal domain-containing protein [Bernardetiaceae bacterium]